MTLEIQILTAVIECLNEGSRPFADITIGSISEEGISAEIAPGYAKSVYLDGSVFQRMAVLLVVKNKTHKTAMETAFSLADTVRKNAKNREIHTAVSGISMGTGPEFVQRKGADYFYSLIFNIDYLSK
ncbi:MAG: hypothetical protein FWH20_00285 [Oscillospiraceae bacterium]|nr:hypothetical protein [Oscillospiraceae bacterium]